MILYIGKNKGMTKEALLKAYLKATRPAEPLKTVDFCLN